MLVDADEAFASSLASQLGAARPALEIRWAPDGETALRRLRQRRVDLLIADVSVAGVGGVDLILEARRAALALALAFVVTCAQASLEVRRFAVGAAIPCLEKPIELAKLLELVDVALERSEIGFSGAISVQTLPDVVQLYALSSATGQLRVRHREDDGEIWFDRGEITHAAASSGARGDDAFFAIMRWKGGDFSVRMGVRPEARTIRTPWTELLMESGRRADEEARTTGDSEPRVSRTGWTLAPPPGDEPGDPFERAFAEAVADHGEAPEQEPHSKSTTDHQTCATARPGPLQEDHMNIKESLAKLNVIDGFIGAALVDADSGMLLGQEGGGNLNLEVAAAGNTEVVRAKRKTMQNLNLKGETIEDVLITLNKQYHLIRPLRSRPSLFFYVALDRQRANLAMARISLADVEKDLQV
jgi:DNA-binding response OmpR family regulator/predicted regulator of Ras-like GTPase activity (Roadblock/LC7/MglB family)